MIGNPIFLEAVGSFLFAAHSVTDLSSAISVLRFVKKLDFSLSKGGQKPFLRIDQVAFLGTPLHGLLEPGGYVRHDDTHLMFVTMLATLASAAEQPIFEVVFINLVEG